jgi:hypothetical protein
MRFRKMALLGSAFLIGSFILNLQVAEAKTRGEVIICEGNLHPNCYSLVPQGVGSSTFLSKAAIRKGRVGKHEQLPIESRKILRTELDSIRASEGGNYVQGCPGELTIETYESGNLLKTEQFCELDAGNSITKILRK